ncbi:MAG: CatB-related O-acetyltransferase [Flavobacteriaceae bacterium]|nr:CatB-related O-acetyltransferase [Flavobacteriaceae bacterium]
MLTFSGKKATWYRFLLKFKNLRDSTGILIGKGSKIVNGTKIGDGSCINGKIVIKGRGDCTIGKYCAMGDDIRIITSNHKVDDVVLQYALLKKIGLVAKVDSRNDVHIGHNVWIGDRAIILPGVTIGNNSIIAAGAIVTKDVSDYAVMAGSPAKLIKYRFSEEEMKAQDQLHWWDWSLEEMKEKAHLLQR